MAIRAKMRKCARRHRVATRGFWACVRGSRGFAGYSKLNRRSRRTRRGMKRRG